jgi:hypothetical protein
MLDVPDRRPVEDIFWTEADYGTMFASAGLELLEVHRPLGNDADPFQWVSEHDVSPWAIYVTGAPRREADIGGRATSASRPRSLRPGRADRERA